MAGSGHDHTTRLFRVSVIIRLRSGGGQEEIERIVATALEERGLSTDDGLKWIAVSSDADPRWYVKFSTVVAADRLDDAWNLRASRHFSKAGYGEVAWKITPVADDDANAEDTTWSVPEDLFRTGWENIDEVQEIPTAAPDSFGSDKFWKWVEAVDGSPLAEYLAGSGPAAPLHPLGRDGLRIICAACSKERDAQGKWRRTTYPHEETVGRGFSHGICPECAKKLYPEYYPD